MTTSSPEAKIDATCSAGREAAAVVGGAAVVAGTVVAGAVVAGAVVAGAVVAVVGLEQVECDGLLRSLAVKAAFRRQGLAHELVKHVEACAAAWGVESLYLLTTTAEHFFLSLGYRPTPRDQAPVGIQGMPQFSDLCPTGSAFLGKRIQPTTIEPEQVPS